MMTMQSTARCVPEPHDKFFWVELDDSAYESLSDIAHRLTAAKRSDRLTSEIVSHLVRVLGGGRRTVW